MFKSSSSIKSLSFSDCDQMKVPILVSTELNGSIHIWHLEKSQLLYSFPKDVLGSCIVDNCLFIPNEPLLLLSSEEGNYIKLFVFNEESSFTTPKLLKERSGFLNNPKKIKFYGDDEKHIMALSSNQIKMVSTINDHITREFSIKKLYENNISINFVDFDINQFRERDWSNTLVLNNQSALKTQGNNNVFSNKKLPLFFSSETSNMNNNHDIEKRLVEALNSINNYQQELTSICISFCGNFGFAGYSKGTIIKFNMQSGNVRKIVENNSDNTPYSAIKSIKSDGLNSVITSISLNKKLVFWEFITMAKLAEIDLCDIPLLLEVEKEKELIAVALSNGKIQIFNKSNFKQVREFNVRSISYKGTSNINSSIINDFCFGNNGNWIIAVTSKNQLLIYDIKSSELIEFVIFDKMPVSISMSMNNILLAVSFSNENYIQLLINREKFTDSVEISNYLSNSDNKQISPVVLSNDYFLNQIKYLSGRTKISKKTNRVSEVDDPSREKISKIVKKNDLIEFSNQNKAKYRLIVYYDFMSKITKPSIKAKEKSSTPFFLFNVNNLSLDNNIVDSALDTTNFKDENSSLVKNSNIFKLNEMLDRKDINSQMISTYLHSLSPEVLDIEIRNLAPELNLNSSKYLNGFITKYLLAEVKNKKNFELVQAYINRLIKVFGDSIITDEGIISEEGKEALKTIQLNTKSYLSEIDSLYKKCLSLVSSLGNIQLN